MATCLVFEDQLRIPLPLDSLAEFRLWAHSDDFPERGRIDFIAGQIEVDMSPEDLFAHGTLKTEIASTLYEFIKGQGIGQVFVDCTRVSCPAANLSVEPDVVFLSDAAIDVGRVRLVPKASGEPDRYIEIEGPPELIVEVVSDSSQGKDTGRLPAAYFAAGVNEFWLVDGRCDPPTLQIFARGTAGYEPVAADGYQRSPTLGRRYRLTRRRNRHGRPVYDLLSE
jgi:Uma2 family endonuclease